ncbi:MAG: SAM-dependent methyltransferase [Bacteroidota bacterium]|nr:SAM-dependent methyltransferase [Bacteroidota bacterium]
MSNSLLHHPSSYRDPSGFIFEKEAVLYRQVNISFKDHFDHFIQSGCYQELVKKKFLIPHEIIAENLTGSGDQYVTIRPERVEWISYPYEWCFAMLKDAALLTLQLVKESLSFDMILKDATPYNIQWHKGELVFIDTLSFEKYEEAPWIAYRQFCESFLGPLLIMHYSKKQLPELMLAWPDGIPLLIVSSLLPKRSRFSLYTYLHIHLHAKYSLKKKGENATVKNFSKQKLLNLIASLESLIHRLKIPVQGSTWSGYYEEASGRQDYLEQKKKITRDWIKGMNEVKTAADLGANKGEFSKLLAAENIPVVAADFDPYCIHELYSSLKTAGERNILPLVLDLGKPSPAIGVNNEERSSFITRSKFDLLLALALIHHLAIGKNIPFEMVADLFRRMGKQLIIEFIPKEDDKIKLLLSRKKDIYPGYNEVNFIKAFGKYFSIIDKKIIPGSGRILFLMQRHEE